MAPHRIEPSDLSPLRRVRLAERRHKVSVENFGRPSAPGDSADAFLDGLPSILAADQLRGLARAVVAARRADRPVVWALGGHLVKTGVTPHLVRLMDRGYVQGLVMNGSTAIHDWEIAAVGSTSEFVEAGLDAGDFGTAEETGAAFAAAAARARDEGRGLGEVLGRSIVETGLPHADASLLAAAHRAGVPVTIHVAVGCDVVHSHPATDGAALGEATYTDFRRLVTLVGDLGGGVWVHCGSAVQLPEVFLKALSAARNLGCRVSPLTTANLDMQRHYRTRENVLRRPTQGGGAAYELIGHHEINIPLLQLAIEAEAVRSGCES